MRSDRIAWLDREGTTLLSSLSARHWLEFPSVTLQPRSKKAFFVSSNGLIVTDGKNRVVEGLQVTVSRDGVTVGSGGKSALAAVGPCAAQSLYITSRGGIVTGMSDRSPDFHRVV